MLLFSVQVGGGFTFFRGGGKLALSALFLGVLKAIFLFRSRKSLENLRNLIAYATVEVPWGPNYLSFY